MKYIENYKYRIYPNENQKKLIEKTFGCCRYVYNRGLEIRLNLYHNESKSISIETISGEMTKWKQHEETKWLNEVNAQALQSSLRNLKNAFEKFFKKQCGFPKFKSRKNSKCSFTNPQRTVINWANSTVKIPKFSEGIKIKLHRKFNGKIKSSIVTKTPAGQYYISINVEYITSQVNHKPSQEKCLGIDLGLIDFATFSDGTKILNPKILTHKLKRLKFLSKKHSRKNPASNNRQKSKKKLAKFHAKIANIRKDFLHKLTKNIVDNQDYNCFAVEDLSIRALMKSQPNRDKNRAIANIGWRTFREYLSYKCVKYGKTLFVIGRFEPSSKMCSCGKINNQLTCKDRVWTCDDCQTTHDRDVLAAQNIRKFAFNPTIPLDERKFKPVETSSDVVEAGIAEAKITIDCLDFGSMSCEQIRKIL